MKKLTVPEIYIINHFQFRKKLSIQVSERQVNSEIYPISKMPEVESVLSLPEFAVLLVWRVALKDVVWMDTPVYVFK